MGEDELWPQIERLARGDVRFRRALSHVWAYESPEFDRRERLLEELGESVPVTLRFVAYPGDFADPPTMAGGPGRWIRSSRQDS